MKSGKRGKILQEAYKIINGKRQDMHGNPEDSFALIGKYWTIYLAHNGILIDDGVIEIQPKEVAEMMMIFKMARMSGQIPSKDNYRDIAGYAAIAADMVEE